MASRSSCDEANEATAADGCSNTKRHRSGVAEEKEAHNNKYRHAKDSHDIRLLTVNDVYRPGRYKDTGEGELTCCCFKI
jgi:hypothetical protein